MNILIVTPYFPPQTGGVATFVDSIQRLMRWIGHEVYVLLPGSSRDITRCETPTNANAYDFYMRSLWVASSPAKGFVAFLVYFVPTLFRLRRFIKQKAIDVITIEYPLPYMFYFCLLRLLMGKRIVVGIHGDDLLSLDLLPRHERWLVRQIIYRADWLLAHSASLMSQAQVLVAGRKNNRSYIPYGVDADYLRSVAEDGTRQFTPPPRPYILTVAKLYKRKGLDVLLQAIRKLGDGANNHHFVIVGDGPEEETLNHVAKSLGIQDRVVFTGELQVQEICMLYDNCEFFVLPSRSEPFGIVLLEAMTFGKAVVATHVGGIPEFVTNGENGILIPSNDSKAMAEQIERMISDRELRYRIGSSGLATVVNKYSYRVVIDQYQRLYQTVLGAKSADSDSSEKELVPRAQRIQDSLGDRQVDVHD